RTDESGRARFYVDTSDLPQGSYQDWTYTFRATVIDSSYRSGEGEGALRVVRGMFTLVLEADRYIFPPNSPVAVIAHAWDHESNRPLKGEEVLFRAYVYGWERRGGREILARGVAKTDAEGKAIWRFEARTRGAVLVEAEGRDSRGNLIVTQMDLYAMLGAPAEGVPAEEVPILHLDKLSYNVGERLTGLLTTRAYGGTALITVEADRLMEAHLLPLDSSATTFSFTVDKAWAPNVYISVVFVKDKRFYTVQKRVNVEKPTSALRVEVIPERLEYRPGESVEYTIRTSSPDGRPIPAECALSVVDESVYAVQEDAQDIYASFYPKRRNQVVTRYSFEEIYFGQADKGGVGEVRTHFLDTAGWIPVIHTDHTGTARVTVRLPDNLTTWRATVKAITDATQVGTSVAKVRVSKPLMIRWEAPRFLTQGDRFVFVAVVHNEREKPTTVKVSLKAEGGVVHSPLERQVRIGAGRSEHLEWDVSVPRPGLLSIQVVGVADNGDRDGVRREVPVLPFGRLVRERFSGEVGEQQAHVSFTLLDGSVREAIRVSIVVTPSLAASLLTGLEELIEYPYGCTEQTMSRMLPAVVVAQVVPRLGLEAPPSFAKIPIIVAESYSRLARFQHYDGGWGWWETDESDPWMTAYVLEGLAIGAEAGFPPPAKMLEEAIEFAREALQKKPVDPRNPLEEELLLCRALGLHRRLDVVRNYVDGVDVRAVNDPKRLVLLLEIFTLLKEKVTTEQILSKLVSLARVQGSMVHWPEGWYGVETTAFALSAIARASPNHPIVPKVVRWLLMQRRGGAWLSTRDTSRAILGIAEYVSVVNEVQPSYTLSIQINGHEVKSLLVTPENLLSPALSVEMPANVLQPGRNVLTLVKEGRGRAYYSVEISQVVAAGSEGRLLRSSDLTVERSFHRLAVRRLDDGTLRLMPSKEPVKTVRSGELVRCKVLIFSEKPREFFMLECPVPAGCEIAERGSEELDIYDWRYWWTSTDVRDDKIVFFFRELPAGTSKLEFTLRAGTPGEYRALPVVLSNMYDPDARAETGSAPLTIKP
ncbi:MAG: alpha-2-macroglobulin family protein, partial [Candidatus Caldarchaeum sp.]